jgi:glutathione peroxidase
MHKTRLLTHSLLTHSLLTASALCASLTAASQAHAAPASDPGAAAPVILNHELKTLDGESVRLSDYRGKALLIVNTASFCGFTSQYADLKALQTAYAPRGFTVLAFPCNDFGGQEPGSAQEIKTFCQARFEVNFPLFEKVSAKGPKKSPLYKTLTEETAEGIRGEVRWNFTKFLVNPKGEVVARFEPSENPNGARVREAIEAALPR